MSRFVAQPCRAFAVLRAGWWRCGLAESSPHGVAPCGVSFKSCRGTLRNRLSHSLFALPWSWLCRTGRFGLPYGPFCTAKRAVLFGKTALAVRLPLRVGMFRVAQVGSRPAVVACRRRPCATDIFCPCVLKIPRMIIYCGLKCVTLQRFLR